MAIALQPTATENKPQMIGTRAQGRSRMTQDVAYTRQLVQCMPVSPARALSPVHPHHDQKGVDPVLQVDLDLVVDLDDYRHIAGTSCSATLSSLHS